MVRIFPKRSDDVRYDWTINKYFKKRLFTIFAINQVILPKRHNKLPKTMSMSIELNVARKKLSEVLGDDMKLYLLILKSWFRRNISREEFDYDARKLIPPECLHLHNEFLLAILSKCQSLGSSLGGKESTAQSQSSRQKNKKFKSKRRPQARTGFNQRFVPSDPLKNSPQTVVKQPEDEAGVPFCTRDLTLPDLGMLHGRMLVQAWDCGLDEVDDTAVNLMKLALENHLKNVITAVLSRRSGYRIREKRFRHSMGLDLPSVYLRNACNLSAKECDSPIPTSSILPSNIELAEMDAVSLLACSAPDSEPKTVVTMYDVLHALQQFRSIMASHTMHASTVEKALHRIWHPSNEETDQDNIHKQELELKQELSASAASGD